jgi:hypothetical protein
MHSARPKPACCHSAGVHSPLRGPDRPSQASVCWHALEAVTTPPMSVVARLAGAHRRLRCDEVLTLSTDICGGAVGQHHSGWDSPEESTNSEAASVMEVNSGEVLRPGKDERGVRCRSNQWKAEGVSAHCGWGRRHGGGGDSIGFYLLQCHGGGQTEAALDEGVADAHGNDGELVCGRIGGGSFSGLSPEIEEERGRKGGGVGWLGPR